MDLAALAERIVSPRRTSPDGEIPDRVVELESRSVAVFHRSGSGAGRALLLHGWEASHTSMSSISTALGMLGWEIIAPDLPAHGASSGESVTIPESARAILAIDELEGPFDLLVAHSVGTAVALLALKRGLRARHAVLIAPPARYLDQLRRTLARKGLPEVAIAGVLAALRERSPDLDEVDSPAIAANLSIGGAVVIADGDTVLSPDDGREIAAAWPGARLVSLAGVGHNDILDAPQLIEAMLTEARAAGGQIQEVA